MALISPAARLSLVPEKGAQSIGLIVLEGLWTVICSLELEVKAVRFCLE